VKAVVLESARSTLRPVTADDIDELSAIRSKPEVARWWRARTAEEVQGEWVKALAEGEAHWTVWADDRRIGFIQAYEEVEDDFRHAGIDIYLDPTVHGRGHGREATARVARFLFEDLDHHRVIIDPTVSNSVAVRCYERVGFKRVGVMREYWFDHVEQRWADGLLMDLLPGDLRPADIAARSN
jgi:aminoglycoside 6'-N-acetyltransferase